jgi:hypothetical protein
MSERTPCIEFECLPAPSDGFLVTHFITVRSVPRSRWLLRGSRRPGGPGGEPMHAQAV